MAEIDNLPSYFIEQLQKANLIYDDTLTTIDIPQDILNLVPIEAAIKYHIIPLEVDIDNNRLTIITDSEQTFKQRALVQEAISSRYSIKLMLTREENLQKALMYFYHSKEFIKSKNYTNSNAVASDDITPLRSSINSILQAAASNNASDIHILPHSHGVYVHFRIHGHMVDYTSQYALDSSQALNIANLIKQMDTSGRVDQTKTNMPNEGSFSIYHANQEIFIRMETLPVGNIGTFEKINLRLLPQATASNQASVSLDNLGYFPEDLEAIKRILFKNATGIFLTSGPTGAGKTTALYAMINYVLDMVNEPLNVITIDDPIEIREERFTQVQVREAQTDDLSLNPPKIGKAGLRSDPDIFLYNEIRDDKAAEVAIELSTTGHKTFSTVHAADCLRTLNRLLDLKISYYSFLSELKLIISQRLIALLCPYCSKEHKITSEELSIMSEEEKNLILTGISAGNLTLRERNFNKDCPHCNAGLKGRIAVAEYIEMTDALVDELMQSKGLLKTKETLKKAKFKSMWEKGLGLALEGKVELGEIIHVIGHD